MAGQVNLLEANVPELLAERYEATKAKDDDKVGFINDLIEERRAKERREEAERLAKERREEAERQERERREEAERLAKERREEAEREAKERKEVRELEKMRMTAAAGFDFSGALENFRASLGKRGINSPEEQVLDTLVRRFPFQLSVVARDPDRALDLYYEIKTLPSTTTTAKVENESQIYLNGSLGPENINILVGSKSDKTPVVVKILVAKANHPRLSFADLSTACRNEAEICMRLDLSSTTLPFVRSEVVNIGDSNGISRQAIIMPMYVRTVADSARLWPASLIDGSKRMVQALEYMHGLGLVHMDVKGSNIFIDQAGDWYLGDFGSTCNIGHKVITTTPSFYPTNLCGLPALPKYDWFMLLVTVLIELMPKKHEWATELCETQLKVVTLPRVAQALQNALDSAGVSELLKPSLLLMAGRSELF